MKKALKDLDDARQTLVDQAPLFGSDYRYTVNMRAYAAIMYTIGIGLLLLGIVSFFTNELPYSAWRETAIMSKNQTDSLCAGSHQGVYTFKYSYAVDNQQYQTQKGYCEYENAPSVLFYNPSDPSQSILKRNQGSSLYVIVPSVAIIIIVFIVRRVTKRHKQKRDSR